MRENAECEQDEKSKTFSLRELVGNPYSLTRLFRGWEGRGTKRRTAAVTCPKGRGSDWLQVIPPSKKPKEIYFFSKWNQNFTHLRTDYFFKNHFLKIGVWNLNFKWPFLIFLFKIINGNNEKFKRKITWFLRHFWCGCKRNKKLTIFRKSPNIFRLSDIVASNIYIQNNILIWCKWY